MEEQTRLEKVIMSNISSGSCTALDGRVVSVSLPFVKVDCNEDFQFPLCCCPSSMFPSERADDPSKRTFPDPKEHPATVD